MRPRRRRWRRPRRRSRRPRRRAGGESGCRNSEGQSRLHASHFADRWHRGSGAGAGRQSGGPASEAVTTVSTLDPIKANFTVSEQEYLDSRGMRPEVDDVPLELILADGTRLSAEGQILFADRQVNPNTGAIRLTGLFPESGKYAAARASMRKFGPPSQRRRRARCWFRNAPSPNCRALSGRGGRPEQQGADRHGSGRRAHRFPCGLSTTGLKPGERVVTEGVQKVGPGTPVNPKPFAGRPQ